MKEKVYFIKIKDNDDDSSISQKIEDTIKKKELLSFIQPKDMVAVKTHFGEENTKGYIRPVYMKALNKLLKEKKALPFLTETSTLYRGKRTNAIEHIEHANQQGFTIENTGMSIIMADGLVGDEEVEVEIPGKHYDKVGVASLMSKVQATLFITHFTGHMISGFGGSIKNMGMGCTSRKAKVKQHSTSKPAVKQKKCVGCEDCYKWCPHDAITMIDNKAKIKNSKCVGCSQCLAVCRFDAIGYNWAETSEKLQEKIVEHAMGVDKIIKSKSLFINFLTRITKDCDCLANAFDIICPDIGILVSTDPVAIDAASLDLVEKQTGKKMSELAFDIPYKVQLEYAKKIGFGNPDYQLIEV